MEVSLWFRWAMLLLMAVGGQTISSTAPVWVASSFFKSGAVSFTFSSWSSQNVTVTYSSPIVNTNLKKPVLGITDLNYQINSGRIQLYLKLSRFTTTYFKFLVTANSNSYLSILRTTYMTIDNSFTAPFSMNYFFPRVNYQSSTGFAVRYYVNFTSSTGVLLNTSHENVLLPFMHYIDVTTSDSTIDLGLEFTLVNSSYYSVRISTTSNMLLKYTGFSRIIFDKTAIEALGSDYFNYGIISSTNNNVASLATVIPPDIIPQNLFFGLHSFTIMTGLSQVNYNSAYTVISGAIGLIPAGSYSFTAMKWSYMHHKTRNCPATHTFYNISELLCYDQCAEGWYGDLSTMTCKQCLYDCQTCVSASACATCNSTTGHRTLSFSRCAPEPGYYDDGTDNPVAQPCSSPCATCVTSGSYCLTCDSGYYISGSSCLACSAAITFCSTCTNGSYCVLCNDGIMTGSTCTICTATQYLNTTSNTCVDCSSVVTYCSSCSSSTTCTLCQTTFTLASPTSCTCSSTQYISGSTCLECSIAVSSCASCTDATTCTSCDSTFTLLSATNCACSSSSFLNTTTSQCEPCTQVAVFCLSCNSAACTTCMSNFTLNSGACECASGFYGNSTTQACESCSIITNCLTCSDVATCTGCAVGYKVNTTSGECVVQPCTITNCDTCVASSTTVCQSCYAGYSIESGGAQCLSYCGNNAMDSSQACDDGNSVSGDGCSSTCTEESGFGCTNQVVNSSNTYSWCFYNSPITFSQVWIRKFEGNNSLKFEFQIDQDIAQWGSVNFKDILVIDQMDEVNMSTGLIGDMIDNYWVGYKEATNRFWVIVDYINYDMEATSLSFELTPYAHSAYPAFTPPSNVEFRPETIEVILTVIANNNQNANLYTDYEYGLYGVSVVVTYIVVGLAIFAGLTSLVFRAGKVMVFEMIAVMQITYFSIASLDSFNPIFSGLLPLRFLAGILNFQDIEGYLEQTSSPNAMKGIYMFLNLLNNFDFVAAGLGCFVGLGGILLGVYFTADYCANPNTLEDDSKKPHERNGYCMYRLAFHFIGQIGLSIIFFCLPLFTVSIFFESLFTMGDSNMLSYAEALAVGLTIVLYFVVLVKTGHSKGEEMNKLGEFVSQFSTIGCFQTLKYPNFQLIEMLVISGLVMATIYSNSKIFSAMCIVFTAVIDIVIVSVVKPYRYGFVSCFKGEQNETEQMFQKIELYKIYDKEQPSVVRVEHPDLTEKSEENDNSNNSEVFAQHFATKRNNVKSKHQGLVTGGEILNQTKLFLFNNNTRRIMDLATIIVVQFIFISAKIYETEINKSYPQATIQNMLPLIIHIVLFLNVSYNYTMLILHIMNHRRVSLAKVDNNPDFNTSEHLNKSVDIKRLETHENRSTHEHNSIHQSSIATTNKLIIKNNTTAVSFYDHKRPQISKPERIKRKHHKKDKSVYED